MPNAISNFGSDHIITALFNSARAPKDYSIKSSGRGRRTVFSNCICFVRHEASHAINVGVMSRLWHEGLLTLCCALLAAVAVMSIQCMEWCQIPENEEFTLR